MPRLSGSQSHFSVTFINLRTKNIWYVLGAWEAGKHLVSLVFLWQAEPESKKKGTLQLFFCGAQAGFVSQAGSASSVQGLRSLIGGAEQSHV